MRTRFAGSNLSVFRWIVGLLLAARTVAAQMPGQPCDYSRCALNIIPRLSALDVVRGDAEQPVGSLSFLLPRRITPAFGDDPVARQHAERAFAKRRAAAVLTNAGAVVLLAGVLRGSPAAGISGAALVGLSVPIHFSADAELSRAVHEFNRRFAQVSR